MRCSDGGPNLANSLCEHVAVLLPPSEVNLSADGDLVMDGGVHIAAANFCLVHSDGRSSALVCAPPLRPWDLATIVCMLVSFGFLACTLAVYCGAPRLRTDLQDRCLVRLMVSLLATYLAAPITYILPRHAQLTEASCLVIIAILYTVSLCIFFWLNVLSVHVYRTLMGWPRWLTCGPRESRIWLAYNVWGWGGPLALLALTLALHHIPAQALGHLPPAWGRVQSGCVFGDFVSVWLYFYGPVFTLLLCNCALYATCAWHVRCRRHARAAAQSTSRLLTAHARLFVLMGVCWILKPLNTSALVDYNWWRVIEKVNSLQGVLLFVLLVVLRRSARAQLASWCPQRWRNSCPTWCCPEPQNSIQQDNNTNNEDDDVTQHQVPLTTMDNTTVAHTPNNMV